MLYFYLAQASQKVNTGRKTGGGGKKDPLTSNQVLPSSQVGLVGSVVAVDRVHAETLALQPVGSSQASRADRQSSHF